MRLTGLALALGLAAGPLAAQDAAKEAQCNKSAAVVMEAVAARKAGAPKEQARRMLREKLDHTAGDMLSDWIYDLPEDQLTDALGTAWKAQCLAAK